jgi:hypothetical protein
MVVVFVLRRVRHQKIWRKERRDFAESGPHCLVDVKQRSCGGANADIRLSVVLILSRCLMMDCARPK